MFEALLFGGIAFLILVVLVAVFGPDNTKRDRHGHTALDYSAHGKASPQFVCPHCQTKGKVLIKPISRKAGISGGKATGALLTGGVSLLATGLSRKEAVTEAYCNNCSTTWHF